VGLDEARAPAQVLEAIGSAELILLAPSNPVVSIDTILNVPGIRDAIRSATAPVVGLSPIIGGAPVRGMADACLPAIGVETSAEGVGRFYGARTGTGVLDGWLVDAADQAQVDGVRVMSRPLLMTDDKTTAAMISDAVELALAR
jgi:LPPG:FO 2-phospho-L-lactate transferase